MGTHPINRWGDLHNTSSKKQQFGQFQNGAYYPISGDFSVVVSGNWQVDVSGEGTGLQLRVENLVDDCAVEIWKYEGIQYRPASKEGCIWSFQDKGLYISWGQSRAVNVGTCHPIDSTSSLVFVYLYHQEGYTWQLESHISRDNLVDGLHQSESVLQSITWFDDATN